MQRIHRVNNAIDLSQLDLNLLVVFRQLLVDKRVSKAAESLGLSQPAVSNALGRLRRALGDDLFLRTQAGMVPTPCAEQLAEPISTALGIIHGAVHRRTSFDPATSDRAFRIGMTDIGEIYFLPTLMDELARIAPHVTVSTVRTGTATLRDEMEAGQVDVAVGFLPQLKAGFFQRRLFTQRYVCLFRKGHRFDKRRITLKEFSSADHVVVVSAGTGHGKVDELLERGGVQRSVRLTVPHFVAVGPLLATSDRVATVPERFAQTMTGPYGLAYLPHPATLPPTAIHLFWHAKFHRDAANRWLRALVVRLHADAQD